MANKTDKLIVNNIKNTVFVIPFISAAACGYCLENHHHALADAEACAWIAREIL